MDNNPTQKPIDNIEPMPTTQNTGEPSPDITPTTNNTPSSPTTPTQPKKSAKTWVICGVIAVLVITVITLAVLLMLNNKTTPNGNEPEQPAPQGQNAQPSEPTNTVVDNTDEDVNTNNTSEASNDWLDYEFSINGKVLTLPLSYESLSQASGFTMKTDDTENSLADNYYTLVNLYKNNSLALYTEIINDSGNRLNYPECTVSRIGQTDYMRKNGADTVIFPGNLSVGMQIDEDSIHNLFGEPNKRTPYSSDGYNKITYLYNENTDWTTTNYYQIEVVNGVIDGLYLDNR